MENTTSTGPSLTLAALLEAVRSCTPRASLSVSEFVKDGEAYRLDNRELVAAFWPEATGGGIRWLVHPDHAPRLAAQLGAEGDWIADALERAYQAGALVARVPRVTNATGGAITTEGS